MSIVQDPARSANSRLQVLEYTLFQPGFFLNYFTFPYKSAKHIDLVEFSIDFNNRRAMRSDNDDGRFTLTTVQDLANIVARAVEYDGEWPVVGGIKGTELSLGELIAIGEKIRGRSTSKYPLQCTRHSCYSIQMDLSPLTRSEQRTLKLGQ